MPATQRGQAYRLGPNRWGLRYYDAANVRRRKSPFPSKSAALAYYRDLERMSSDLAGWRARQPEGVRYARMAALREALEAAVRRAQPPARTAHGAVPPMPFIAIRLRLMRRVEPLAGSSAKVQTRSSEFLRDPAAFTRQ